MAQMFLESHTNTHTHTEVISGGGGVLVSKRHAVKMILMLEIMTTLVMGTYHSRYMALLKERSERDRKMTKTGFINL